MGGSNHFEMKFQVLLKIWSQYFEKAPKIAVYTPKISSLGGGMMQYCANICRNSIYTIYDEEVLKINWLYDWLHFTSQFYRTIWKVYNALKCSMVSSKKKDAEMLIKQLGFSSIGRKKGAVKKLEILIGGGFITQCVHYR
jgi:hypothetical protein